MSDRRGPGGRVLWLKRGEIGRRRQQIIRAEVCDNRSHERSLGSRTIAVLRGERPASLGTGPSPRRSSPWHTVQGVTLPPLAVTPFSTRAWPFLRLPRGT